MKKTENYGLNQWDAGDRIRMEDFNADNENIETALLGKTGRMELIREETRENTSQGGFTIVPPIKDWSQWEYVVIFVNLSSTTFKDNDRLRCSVAFSDITWYPPKGGLYTKAGDFMLVLFPMHSVESKTRALLGGEMIITDRRIGDFLSFSVFVEGDSPKTVVSSTQISFYGIR